MKQLVKSKLNKNNYGDHHGYEIYGVELRKASDKEIATELNQAKKEHKVRIQNKIDILEEELGKLKEE